MGNQRRVSYRLKCIYESKQLHYGTSRMDSSQWDKKCQESAEKKAVREATQYTVSNGFEPKNGSNVWVQMKSNQSMNNQGSSAQRRVSPRLKNISASERPYYGVARRNTLQPSREDKNQENVHSTRSNGLKSPSKLPRLVSKDISGGLEDISIPATNSIDDAPVAPTGFIYSVSIQIVDDINLPPNAEGCNCKGNCTNPKACACARLNGTDFPYVRKKGDRLIEAKDVVFECGPNCCCGPDCINRTSQRGIKFRLEVFRTPKKGWAVWSRDFIPSGAPVCEYIGVLRRTDELDNVAENDYIFEIDCLQTIKEIGGREKRLGDASMPINIQLEKIDDKSVDSTPEFCIDAGSVGNVARFINHSCDPNLFVQCVLRTHHDARLARVVLFAADDIAPFQELTYDYGYALDSVVSPDGKVKQQPCHCGAADCRKRLY